MLIGVDGYEASAPNRVGVGRFVVELLKALHEYDTTNSYRIYTPYPPISSMPARSRVWQYKICAFSRLWSQISLPYYIYRTKPIPDVFFSPVHFIPRFVPIPCIVGIMDLSFLHFPDYFKHTDLFKLTHWTSYSIHHVKHIISISRHTKNDIISLYNCAPSKITVVHPGVTHMHTTNYLKTGFEEIKSQFAIKGKYILYVGTLQPRKNVTGLIDAYKRLADKKLQLVIVGKKGWQYDSIFEKVRNENLQNKVIFTGYVNSEILQQLYSHAECFVLVSLYEGFGFPVLEAMDAGVPVITSNVSSLPEVAGDAALLVDPLVTDEITNAIEKILKFSPEERKRMIDAGKKQAMRFTWEKTAKETLSVLEGVVEK